MAIGIGRGGEGNKKIIHKAKRYKGQWREMEDAVLSTLLPIHTSHLARSSDSEYV